MRKKELIELSVTGILLVIMLFALGNAIKSGSGHVKGVLPATGSSLALPMAQADQRTSSKDLYNFLEKQAELIELKRDPFTAVPIIIKKGTQSGIALTGILWDKEKPLAVIDGKIVKEGQRIGDKIVIEIRHDRAILSDGDVLSEVKLKQ